DDQVVDHPALLVEHAGVERLALDLELVDRVGDQLAQEVAHAAGVQVDHGHVRDIEHAGTAAHRMVLLDLRTIVERHVPAAEVHHLRAECAMGVVEDRLAGHGRLAPSIRSVIIAEPGCPHTPDQSMPRTSSTIPLAPMTRTRTPASSSGPLTTQYESSSFTRPRPPSIARSSATTRPTSCSARRLSNGRSLGRSRPRPHFR